MLDDDLLTEHYAYHLAGISMVNRSGWVNEGPVYYSFGAQGVAFRELDTRGDKWEQIGVRLCLR